MSHKYWKYCSDCNPDGKGKKETTIRKQIEYTGLHSFQINEIPCGCDSKGIIYSTDRDEAMWEERGFRPE